MYHTYVTHSREDDLARLDAALLGLRRLTSAPTVRSALEHEGGRVEVSTMLVVDALARQAGVDASVGSVAEALSVAHSTASRLVERAVEAGMVQRGRDPRQSQRTVLSLTASGRRLQAEAVRFRTAFLAAVTDDWSATDVAELAGHLERFAAAVHHHLPDTRGRRP